ncbi:MAG: hypothetical protein A3B91_00830 [Candidatus Yanofskybacteria bacterium RIFCSPHIGHO2_02_FULL_41_29]|uniref:Uncharacterized protein n=1 Tax=Candidatus Yanofskybacteria bacterium RIFCSPHIGHO2_01_FULL_41_53 TaxID=1802663 RepID=A0A1F8EKI5_9BACT|nr:MAG: hypothetical protein A2650_00400 [Candidatus Yanofskybacteria bacterium RIFCSPHIGHO2_01_FULL_41_53]OGN12287.1 MAG: hypothetical protein A3B91_00830 [Candidatus Yanofskybacteria bacterium RIFCSPHIGHO2_02_FULL_41_29]OGN17024.1 MAG: hypothetical protein A3F48_03700 [Candidatus Yanofskybacteria bacterium RIFCSPHIGHO2_12_FULL_41_9]OGN23614.1 MAG: hypothetical protein A2916_01485 [Candidatus Yanofskybacteria bacterium RIFCSPLOWO2_01_FULL_41_67]OGN29399.1 MAG: hypothetical protein A3H54_04040 
MDKYIDWLTGFGYLRLQSWQMMTFYLVLAFILLGVRVIAFAKYIYPHIVKENEVNRAIHGQVRSDLNLLDKIGIILFLLLGFSVGPFF